MKIENFDQENVGRGRYKITFKEPLKEGYEMNIILRYFKKYKSKVRIMYKLQPEVEIKGIICHHRTWSAFLKKLKREEAEILFRKRMEPFKSEEDMLSYLKDLQQAEINARKQLINDG